MGLIGTVLCAITPVVPSTTFLLVRLSVIKMRLWNDLAVISILMLQQQCHHRRSRYILHLPRDGAFAEASQLDE
jgi:hypothetical protein